MAIIKNILWREDCLRLGLKIPIDWDMETTPHACCFGATGTGKTYLIKLLLAKAVLYDPASHLTVCDGKGSGDFDFLRGCQRYASVDIGPAFNGFYDAFIDRQKRSGEGEKFEDSQIICIDEWSAHLDSIEDKKVIEAQKRQLANLLRLGRSFHFHVILGQQRMDSSYFQSSRDNFSLVVGTGNASKESRDMFWSEFREQVTPDRSRGTGFATIGGMGFVPIAVPHVKDVKRLHLAILQGVTR